MGFGNELLRHALLLPAMWRYSIRRELEFRTNFALYSATYAVFAGFTFVLTVLVFVQAPLIGGWQLEDAWVVMTTAQFVHALLNALFYRNLATMVAAVPRGELDFILLKPVNAQFFLSFRFLLLHHVPTALFALAALVWAVLRLPVAPSLAASLLFVLLVGCAIVICYAIWFMVATIAVRVERATNIHELMDVTLQFARFPTDAFIAPLRFFFTLIVPVAFVATIPAKALLGRASAVEVGGAIALAPVLLVLSHVFWARSLRRYVSASS